MSPRPLRSPLRRWAVVLVGPLVAFGLFDLGRAWLQASPREVQADEFSATFFHEHVTVVGVPHFDEILSYAIERRRRYERSLFGGETPVEPYALVPLNRPSRSGDRLVLAEVPLVNDDLPEDMLDGYRYEFTGLAGPLPDDIRVLFERDFPAKTVFTRVQLRRGAPSASVSLAWLGCAALLALWLWRAALRYERSDDARGGVPQRVSRFLLLLGGSLPLVVLWKRFRLQPDVDAVSSVIVPLGLFWLALAAAGALRGRRLEGYDRVQEEDTRPEAVWSRTVGFTVHNHGADDPELPEEPPRAAGERR